MQKMAIVAGDHFTHDYFSWGRDIPIHDRDRRRIVIRDHARRGGSGGMVLSR